MFGLAGFLRARHDRLYDVRIAEMRRVSKRQLRTMAAADLASALTIAGAIAIIMWLAVSHHMALSAALAGTGALVVLGGRLAFAGQSAGMLQESAMFINDSSRSRSSPRKRGRREREARARTVRSHYGGEGDVQLPGVRTGRLARHLPPDRAGQWQRLALARTFFRDAPLVILDEPTAALDAKAEHELFARIGELFADRSVLLISHRFSTVRSADRIYQ